MAIIIATFNTEDKKLEVTMDGKKMKDVSEASFYTYGESGGVEVRSVKSEEDDNMMVITKVIANEEGTKITEESDAEVTQKELASLLFAHNHK